MKSARAILTIAVLMLSLPTQAQDMESQGSPPNVSPAVPGDSGRAVGDPLVLVYRVVGVTDNGGAANTGVATSFHCTPFGGSAETIRIVVRAANGAPLPNALPPNPRTVDVPNLNTITFSTHPTVVFQDAGANSDLATGFVGQGSADIFASTQNVVCTAMIVDAAAPPVANAAQAVGISLAMHRFPPLFTTPAVASFDDVPPTHPFFAFIEILKASGITSGCNVAPPRYCPDAPITRGQMAVFLTKGLGFAP